MLNDTIKQELLKRAEKIEVDVSELDSYRYISNIYMTESALAKGDYDWDETEEYHAQLLRLADCIEIDGLCEYATLADDEDLDGEMTQEAVLWLRSLGDC